MRAYTFIFTFYIPLAAGVVSQGQKIFPHIFFAEEIVIGGNLNAYIYANEKILISSTILWTTFILTTPTALVMIWG